MLLAEGAAGKQIGPICLPETNKYVYQESPNMFTGHVGSLRFAPANSLAHAGMFDFNLILKRTHACIAKFVYHLVPICLPISLPGRLVNKLGHFVYQGGGW